MNHLAQHQVEALEHASDMAGQYLGEIKKTDLGTLTKEEWFELLKVIVCRYQEHEKKNAPCPF